MLAQGNVYVHTINLSKNKCDSSSSVIILDPSELHNCSISFSSISQNTALFALVDIGAYNPRGNFNEIKSSNILGNKGDNSSILIRISQNTHISDCCILNNTQNIYFHFFARNNNSIIFVTISNCTIGDEDLMKIEGTGSISTNGYEWKANPSFIHDIQFTFDNEHCRAYDSVEEQTYNQDVYDSLEEENLSTSSSTLLEYMFIICFLNQYPEDSWFS